MGKKYSTSEGEILAIVIIVAVVLIIAPFISYWCAYFGGWIASVTIGGVLCNSLNTLFGTTRFTPDMLPPIAGALGWIGGFFRTMRSSKQN